MYLFTAQVKLPGSSSLAVVFSGKIKELLSAELDIPVSKMELRGWIHKNDALIQDEASVYIMCIRLIVVL